MYKNEFYNTKKKLTVDDIVKFQKKFNIRMPEEIKKHYLAYNGGYPEKSAFHTCDGRIYVVNYFFSISCGEGLVLEKTLVLLNDEKIFPKWLIPIANDEGGNLFCYSVKENEEGAIYYYNHEFEYGENPEKYVILLSRTITEFINSLEEYEEED